jgi:hypothetical protein
MADELRQALFAIRIHARNGPAGIVGNLWHVTENPLDVPKPGLECHLAKLVRAA